MGVDVGINLVRVSFGDVTLELMTDKALFSPRGPDAGTMAMLLTSRMQPSDRVLDLGCGYGLVGIYAAKVIGCKSVVMTDVDAAAVRVARENALANGVASRVLVVQSDGFDGLGDDAGSFTLVLSNPPYHTDFAVPKRFIEGAFRRLAVGGRLMMVVKRDKWYRNKMSAVFGGVKVTNVDGYYVLESVKRASVAAPPTSVTTRKHAKRVAESSRRKRR